MTKHRLTARIVALVIGSVLMATTFTVAVDWNNDGDYGDAGENITQYVYECSVSRGFSKETSHVADIGRMSLVLDNTDRRFSPLNSGGPYYGNILPYRPVRVRAHSGASTWDVFNGFIQGVDPMPGIGGDLTARLWAGGTFSLLYRDFVGMPLQENDSSDGLINKILADVFNTQRATGSVYITPDLHDADPVTVGKKTYTFRDTLTATANEVLIGGAADSALNLVSAINADATGGTRYSSATIRNGEVTAASGWAQTNPITERDLYGPIDDAISWSQPFVVVDDWASFLGPYLDLQKNGSPVGNIVVRIETDNDGPPSGTLVHANATATIDASTITTTADAWTHATMTGFALPVGRYHIVLTSTVPEDLGATDWVGMGFEKGLLPQFVYNAYFQLPPAPTWYMQHQTSGLYYALMFDLPGEMSLTANAPGEWGNGVVLDAGEYHADANSLTINTGSILSGNLADTNTANGELLVLAEVGGTPGFDYEIDANVTGTGLNLILLARYAGNPAHTVNVNAWNGATWDTLGTMPSVAELTSYDFTLSAAHTIGGVVLIQFDHTSAGVATHELIIDNFYVFHSLPSSATEISLSGPTLTGGTNAPASKADIDAGLQSFPVAADQWTEDDTRALTACSDVTYSEHGLLYEDGEGKVVFKNRNFELERPQTAVTLTSNGIHHNQRGAIAEDRIRNHVIVSYTPRRTLATGVVARSNNSIKVAGKSGVERWNKDTGYVGSTSTGAPQPGDRVVRLPFRDVSSGNTAGAKDLITPQPSTDYTVTDNEDGSGWDYTAGGRIGVSMAVDGGAVEVSFTNTAMGPLYVHNFQVRGSLVVSWDQEEEIFENTASIAAYGKRVMRYALPMESTQVFTESLASYLCARYQPADYVIDTVQYTNITEVGGVNLLSLAIGDVVQLSEDQTGTDAIKGYLRGYDLFFEGDAQDVSLTLRLKPVPSETYWVLGDATYSVLDYTTRLGI